MTAISRTGLWTKLLAVNSTNNTAPARTIVNAKPTAETVITFDGLNPDDNLLRVVPFGTDAENETGSLYIYRWQAVVSGSTTSYFPTLAGIFTFALSSITGVASGVVVATEFFTDTIAQTASSGDNSGIVIALGANQINEVRIPIVPGTWGIEIVPVTGGSTASINALVMVS